MSRSGLVTEYLHTKVLVPCLYGTGFVHRGIVMAEQQRALREMLLQGLRCTIVLNTVALSFLSLKIHELNFRGVFT